MLPVATAATRQYDINYYAFLSNTIYSLEFTKVLLYIFICIHGFPLASFEITVRSFEPGKPDALHNAMQLVCSCSCIYYDSHSI